MTLLRNPEGFASSIGIGYQPSIEHPSNAAESTQLYSPACKSLLLTQELGLLKCQFLLWTPYSKIVAFHITE